MEQPAQQNCYYRHRENNTAILSPTHCTRVAQLSTQRVLCYSNQIKSRDIGKPISMDLATIAKLVLYIVRGTCRGRTRLRKSAIIFSVPTVSVRQSLIIPQCHQNSFSYKYSANDIYMAIMQKYEIKERACCERIKAFILSLIVTFHYQILRQPVKQSIHNIHNYRHSQIIIIFQGSSCLIILIELSAVGIPEGDSIILMKNLKKRLRSEGGTLDMDTNTNVKRRRVQVIENLLEFLEGDPIEYIQKHNKSVDVMFKYPKRSKISLNIRKLVVLLRHLSLTSDDRIWMKQSEIAHRTGVKESTVSTILFAWRKDGFKFIERIYRRKRGRILSIAQEKIVVNPKVLSKVAHLTLKQRIPILNKVYKIPIVSERTLARMYHRNGVKYRRASYFYNKKYTIQRDLSDRQQIISTEMARQLLLNNKMIYIDETSFNLWTPSHYLWATRSMNFPMQMSSGKSVTCIGVKDEEKSLRHFYIFEGSNNSDRFLHFLGGLLDKQGVEHGKLVMDNLSIHKSSNVKEFFVRHPSLEAYFLPPYSSAMNPIEKVWLVLKGKWRKHLSPLHGEVRSRKDCERNKQTAQHYRLGDNQETGQVPLQDPCQEHQGFLSLTLYQLTLSLFYNTQTSTFTSYQSLSSVIATHQLSSSVFTIRLSELGVPSFSFPPPSVWIREPPHC